LPPAPICSECRSIQLTMKDVNGKGSLYTYTVVHQPVLMEQEMPFVIAIVELDTKGVSNNTVRMMSNIVGASVEPTAIGRAVSVAWEDMSEEVCVPRFRFDS